jgi:glycosyltransferase involved in cell wall biosynthesis
MRIQIISKDNGVGLSHDYRVLKTAILAARPDAQITFCDWQTPVKGTKADVNIFLELLAPGFIQMAPRNIYVPNPEWYYSHLWGGTVPRVTEVWAKTHDCARIFKPLHRKVVYSGWTSEVELPTKAPAKEKRLLHVAGASSAKGTEAVLGAVGLTAHRLTLITKAPRKEVREWVDQVVNPSDAEREALQWSHLIHLCPSTYEGFGHYINEARAMGSVVITTNAAPMNELITKETGLGASVALTSRQNLATHQHVDVSALRNLIAAAMGATDASLRLIGHRAQSAYLRERAEFHAFIKAQLQ